MISSVLAQVRGFLVLLDTGRDTSLNPTNPGTRGNMPRYKPASDKTINRVVYFRQKSPLLNKISFFSRVFVVFGTVNEF